MRGLVNLIYEQINSTDSGQAYFAYIGENFKKEASTIIEEILFGSYQEVDTDKVISYNKKKIQQRKSEWFKKAITGYEQYKDTMEIKRGIYRHLVDYYISMKKTKESQGSILFSKMTGGMRTPEDAVEKIINDIREWKESESTLLIHYPFFEQFGVKIKEKSVVLDGTLLTGSTLSNLLKRDPNLMIEENEETIATSITSQTHISKMPSNLLKHATFSIGGNAKYEINNDHSLNSLEGELVEIRPKHKHELKSTNKMYLKKDALLELEKGRQSIRTPDMGDEALFIKMLEHRHSDFQKNKRIIVYLSDLLEVIYDSKGQHNYKNIKARLWTLANFSISEIYEDESFSVRNLFDGLDVKRDSEGRWYVNALVSDEVRDIIVRDNFVKIYSKKINELEPLARHLSFVVQKERILHHEEGKDHIRFRLNWLELQDSIRLSKRTKKENMDKIEEALSEIRDRNFLIESVYKNSSSSFDIKCYNLNESELKDRAPIRSIFSKKSANQLLQSPLSF